MSKSLGQQTKRPGYNADPLEWVNYAKALEAAIREALPNIYVMANPPEAQRVLRAALGKADE